MEIWLTQGGIRYRVPVLPSEYELTGESNHTQIDVNALGEISLIGKRKLKQISFSSFFPRRLYPFCEYTSFPTPAESVKLVEEMKDNGILRLIMTGTPINMECTIDRFLWGENDGTGDIFYTLDFREYRRVHIKTKTERETLPDTVQPAATERPAKEVSSTTYTVVSGDSLCKIAKKLTGSSANWKVIYEQNRAVIGGEPGSHLSGTAVGDKRMRIEWIRKNDGSVSCSDITEAVSTVRWGGSVSQAARTAEVTLINAPDDETVKTLRLCIGAGDVIKLYENEKVIFSGEVQTAEKLSRYGSVTYSCMDLLAHLLRSTAVYNFENTTAEDITQKVCADFAIETGELAVSNAPIKKIIFDGTTIYDIIMQAYTKASRQTGALYICRMAGTKLSVEVKGNEVQNFVLAEEYNITNTVYQETIENMVNTVKIYDDTGKQVGEVKNDEWIRKFGTYQQIYKKEKGVNEITAATNLLSGIEKRVTLDGIDGDLNCIAGNAVEVQDKAAGLAGIFWIDADTHIWENGTHMMNLELNFKNLMDEKESG